MQTCEVAEEIQRAVDLREEFEFSRFTHTVSDIQNTVSEQIKAEITPLKEKILKDVEKLKVTGGFIDIDTAFDNEDKITTKTNGDVKEWTNNTGVMVQMLSKTSIKEGVHKLRLQSLNDPGGYTVIGITNKSSSD